MKKFFKFLFLVFLTGIYVWISSVIFIFHGPFPNLKKFVMGAIETSMHPQYLQPLALYTLSKDDLASNGVQRYTEPTTQDNGGGGLREPTIVAPSYKAVTDPTIEVDDYKGQTFSAKIMLIRDPKRVKVAVTKHIGDVGETVSEMVQDNQAVAGINGGAFSDTGYRGTGGNPLGMTMHDGNVIVSGSGQPIVGLTKDGAMIAGVYDEQQLKEMNVTEAVAFGPVLIKNGKGLIQGDGGWGSAPRTAIGQRADGTIIMIVTDGRFVHGPTNLGATLRDIQNLMFKYDAVIASNLDGGSSATMIKDGQLINDPTDVLGEREVATSFVVMPENGGE